ncbi:MAG: response regulator [Deltaproteobacteria bacterium]|nr:response regulator [Deltaproteobacteria bacterium]MBN2673644.1 response regulator [Deltaproteobacteria bacterium]
MMHKPRILLVDDDPNLLWGVGKFLTRSGYTVISCPDGAEAIDVLKESNFDAMITDIQMPRLNGLALIEWAVQNAPAMRIIAITAFGCLSVQQILMKQGAILYVEKPFDPKVMLELLKKERSTDSFSGNVNGINLFDYIQLVFMTNRQLKLQITSSDGENGVIYIDKRTACHAECGQLQGVDAFYKCLSFNGGSFVSLHFDEPPKRTIDCKGDFLLMDAARLKDETTKVTLRHSEVPPLFADEDIFPIANSDTPSTPTENEA